jgi:hypothetical protein
MTLGSSSCNLTERRHGWRLRTALIASALAAGACAAASGLPTPRTLVVRSGVRITADEGRMNEIDVWVREQLDNIEFDPSFLVYSPPTSEQTYPWDGLEVGPDTVVVLVYAGAPETRNFLQIYGHFHLMKRMGRLDEFLPEAVDAEGYELERAILARVADAWLYGRAVFDTPPYGPLDELLFAHENGYLDAFILTARPEEFEEPRDTWLRENPGREEEYVRWFVETFETQPPGRRGPD